MSREDDLLAAALNYAVRGIAVLPLYGWENGCCTCGKSDCDSAAKHPVLRHGLRQASSTPNHVRRWWAEEHQGSNIGLVTGVRFEALDIDGDEGKATLAQLEASHGKLPPTVVFETGGGGLHILFQPTGARTHVRKFGPRNRTVLPGIDYKAKNSYIVAPPSMHRSGRRYKHLSGDLDHIAVAPEWLRQLVCPQAEPAEPPKYRTDLDEAGRHYVERAVEGEHDALVRANEQSGWDAQLWASCQRLMELVKAGVLDYEDAVEAIYDGAAPWNAVEAAKIEEKIRRAYDRVEPKGVPEKPSCDPYELTGKVKPQSGEASSENSSTRCRRIAVTPASAIKPKATLWLWEQDGDGRIPLGALVLLAGREGVGKSTVAYQLAAEVSAGRLPGEYHHTPKGVIVVATEDSWQRTVVPRLIAAGADLDRVYRIDVCTSDGLAGTLVLPDDIHGLVDEIKTHDVALILLDPLLSRLDDGLDSHKDAEVRRALEPLIAAIEPLQVTILGLIHLNKSTRADALTQIMASRAFAAVARAVLFVMADPENPDQRLLGQPKNNLGRIDVPTLTFCIQGEVVGYDEESQKPIRTSKLAWTGESHLTIDDAVAIGQGGTDADTRQSAADWLTSFLQDQGGSADSAAIRAAGKVAGYSIEALRWARKKLGVEFKSQGFPRTTYWYLPGMQPDDRIIDGEPVPAAA